MPDTSHILIVTSDAKLKEELLTAVASLGDRAPVANTVETMRQGIEATRNRAPDLVVTELTTELAALRSFTDELATSAPCATIAAVVRPETFDAEVSESALVIDGIRAGIHDFLRRPISSAELLDMLARKRTDGAQPRSASGRVISFISNKGGVGKSTLAVNAAVGLAMRHPDRVLLIDASLQMGVAASMLDISPQVTLTDVARERSRLDETMIRQMVTPHESGLHLLAAPSDAVEAAAVDDEIIARVITLARRVYDFVVIDTFPLFDRVVIAVLDLSDRTYIVVENVVPTVQGAAKMLQVLDGIGFPKERQRVVLNRMTSIAGGLSAMDVATRLDTEIDHVLPYDKRIIAAANIGRPYVMQAGASFGFFNRFAKGFRGLVDQLDALLAPQNGQLIGGNGKADGPPGLPSHDPIAAETADGFEVKHE